MESNRGQDSADHEHTDQQTLLAAPRTGCGEARRGFEEPGSIRGGRSDTESKEEQKHVARLDELTRGLLGGPDADGHHKQAAAEGSCPVRHAARSDKQHDQAACEQHTRGERFGHLPTMTCRPAAPSVGARL